MKKVVAYLDLLGFRNFTEKDPQGALVLLSNYHEIVSFRCGGKRNYLPELYKEYDEKYKNLNSLVSMDSFEYLMPFSDSLFIVSNDPNKFLKQISIFLLDCFLFTAHQYSFPKYKEDPTKVEVISFSRTEEGKLQTVKKDEHWYPTLFRGGITFNKVNTFKINSIENFGLKQLPNLAGKAVVKAVMLENIGKGPRLFCDSKFVEVLNNESKQFIETIDNNKYFEILWPAVYYNFDNAIDNNNWGSVANRFLDIFTPAANLWKAFNHEEFSIHYYKLLKLIVKSSLKYFRKQESFKEIKEYFIGIIEREGMGLKLNDLVEN